MAPLDPGRLLREFRDGLEAIYSARFRDLYLYGSYARDEADRESDIDILVVLDRIQHYGAEIDRTSELVAGLSLAHGISVSRVFVREEDWLRGDNPFLRHVRKEARVVA